MSENPNGTSVEIGESDNSTINIELKGKTWNRMIPYEENLRNWIDELYAKNPENIGDTTTINISNEDLKSNETSVISYFDFTRKTKYFEKTFKTEIAEKAAAEIILRDVLRQYIVRHSTKMPFTITREKSLLKESRHKVYPITINIKNKQTHYPLQITQTNILNCLKEAYNGNREKIENLTFDPLKFNISTSYSHFPTDKRFAQIILERILEKWRII